jgi:AcrR family transcriptional regulator
MAATPRHAAVRADVLRATEDLLAEGATWVDLSVERIAQRAGISRTAFYFYFATKRELLLRLTTQVSVQLYSEAERWFRGDGPPETLVREALLNILRIHREHEPLLRLIMTVAAHDDEVDIFWRELIDGFIAATRERIEQAQAEGLAPPIPAEATAFALVWMFERTCYEHQIQRRFTDEEMVTALSHLFVRGVYGGSQGETRTC